MRVLLAFIFFFAFIGCGKINKYLNPKPYYPEYYETPLSLEEYSESFKATCSDPSNCSDFTGTLLTKPSYSGIGSCTAFLISANRIMTNSHCIPYFLKQDNPQACSNSIVFFLPANDKYVAQKIKCEYVLFNSQPNDFDDAFTFDADYAIIQLARPVNRPVRQITNVGLEFDQKYTIYKSDNNLEGRASNIRKIDCSILPDQNAAAMLSSTNEVNALDCATIKGNSGSPVVNTATTDIVGILYGGGYSNGIVATYITNFQCLEVAPISSYVRHTTCK